MGKRKKVDDGGCDQTVDKYGVKFQDSGRTLFAAPLSITDYVIPDGCQVVDQCAFANCDKLSSITFPDSMRNVLWAAFVNCKSLVSVALPDGLEQLGNGAFKGCASLTSVVIPAGIRRIGEGAFKDCTSLRSVFIPASVKRIDEYAFDECTALMQCELPDGCDVRENAFPATCIVDSPSARLARAQSITIGRASADVEAVGMHAPDISSPIDRHSGRAI